VNPEKRDRTIFVGAVILLVYSFIQALMPVDELPSTARNVLHITVELLMLIGVVGMGPRILRSAPQGGSRGGWIFLMVVGVVSGLGFFAVLISGGPRVELAPRTSTRETGLRHELHEQLVALEELSKKLATTRWLQTFPTKDEAKIRTLTRQNLQEARGLSGEMREHVDRILKVFADATAQGVAHSTLSDEPAAARLETWQATRETYVGTYDYLGLIEQHWDEWLTNPFPTATSDLKPWQLEIRRLMDATAISAQQAHALIDSKTPSTLASSETLAVRKKFNDLIYSWTQLVLTLTNTNWMKADVAHRRTLPRRDLQEALEVFHKTREHIDQILGVLAEVEAKKIDLSVDAETSALGRPEYWRAVQRGYGAAAEKFRLIDQNWEEYIARPFPQADSDSKPWQREVNRLDEEREAASKEMQAILHPSAAPSPPAVAAVTGLAKELRDLIKSWDTSMEKSMATRWVKIDFNDPAQKRTLTRRDFEEAVEFSRVAAGFEERIVKLLAQAKAQGIDVSAATTDASYLRPEFWRWFQDMDALRLKYRKLIDQHWDEWLMAPETVNEKSKPWQREMKKLDDQMDARRKQFKAFMESTQVAAAPSVPATPSPSPTEAKEMKTFEQFVASLNRNAPSVTPTKTAPAPRAPSPPANNMDGLVLKTHMLPAVGDYVTALKRLQATRWIKSPDANSYHPQKITQADLHDAGEKLRDLIAAIDKVRSDLDGQTLPVPAAEKEYWRVKRETSGAFQQLTKLLEDNWKEWHLSGIQPKTGEAKPWQKEALRLQGEIDKLKQIDQTSILL
jgi:hypothetical protein